MAQQSQAFEAAAEAIAGSIGGFISSAVLFPLDYVKTQQQAGTVKGSFLTVAAEILKKQGPLAFYRGAPFRGFQSGYEKIIYFYLFAFARNAYVKRFGALDPIMNLVIGYVSNWAQLPLTMPVDTCVNGMITTGKSFGTMVNTVISNPAGAYKGMAAYSIAALKPAVQFTVVEQMRWRMIAGNAGTQYEGGLSSGQASMMGAVSRIVSDTLLYPARRVKTTRQTLASRVASGQISKKDADDILSKGTLGLIVHMAKEDGFLSLYTGLTPELVRGTLSGSVMLAIKEGVHNFSRTMLLLLISRRQ